MVEGNKDMDIRLHFQLPTTKNYDVNLGMA